MTIHRFCERCERVTADGHLWCERTDCPAEEGYPVFVHGDYLGDLKITRMLRVWRPAALYEALRGDEKVLVKVAHRGDDCEERLKREAVALASLADRPIGPTAFVKSFFPSQRPLLPVPLPPYPVPSKNPYGNVSFRGEIKFYTVFKHAAGKFLSDLLLENPQVWHYEAAWIVIALAEALKPLAAKGRCHLGLSPDLILVDTDVEGHLRPLLLDLGFIVGGEEIGSVVDWQRLSEPAYTAPELQAGKRPKTVSPMADVYSLGMIFYEMLAGKPAFDSKIKRDAQIRIALTSHRGQVPVERPELEQVVKIVEQALSTGTDRFKTVTEFGKALSNIYSSPPREKRPTPPRLYVVLGAFGTVALVTLCVASYLLLQVLNRP